MAFFWLSVLIAFLLLCCSALEESNELLSFQTLFRQRDQVTPTKFYSSDTKSVNCWPRKQKGISEGLAKFLKCVNWKISKEEKKALKLFEQWQEMDTEDALQLLLPQYTNPIVRRLGVKRLSQASNEDILMYLLQLVQALKYENFSEIHEALVDLGKQRSDISNNDIYEKLENYGNHLKTNSTFPSSEPVLLNTTLSSIKNWNSDLATFLIERVCTDDTLANYFYWYLKTELDKSDNKSFKIQNMYHDVMERFNLTLQNGVPEYKNRLEQLNRGRDFVEKLLSLLNKVAKENGDVRRKTERLQALLLDKDIHKIDFLNFEPLLLPLDPSVKVKGIVPEKTTLYISSFMPTRLTFQTVDKKEYVTIFKLGDDLRQDQMVLQTIFLMDKLLQHENLDLKLTPYRVLACSSKHGFIEYIESPAISTIIDEYKDIQSYLRAHAPSKNGPYGIAAEVMDNYVKSLAGYCVITYLLGVGDRHLDNLLLTKNGKLFHIDFGYILGRDPKPMPPKMKLSKEMVAAMGGIHSDFYNLFRQHAVTAFLILRRHGNLFLNLFSLMLDAGIPDIALEPDKAVKKVQDKFLFDLREEECSDVIHKIIEESFYAIMPALIDQLHRIAQFWRR